MKDLSKQEFEEKVQELLDRKITRKKLAKELETDVRTLNNRISKLSVTNPDLYAEFIKNFPYKPKTIEIDIEALAVNVIENGMDSASKTIGISTRTITRKVNTLKKLNPELYDLYKRRNHNMTDEEKAKYISQVSKFNKMKKIERKELENKEAELISILSKFESKLAEGMSKNKAAISLGLDGYPTIWKKYQDLNRIKTQKISLESKEENKKKSFREELQSEYKTGQRSIKNQEHNKDGSKEEKSPDPGDEGIPI